MALLDMCMSNAEKREVRCLLSFLFFASAALNS